jgi:hypothetical protein
MTALAIGSSATVNLPDAGTLSVSTNGGFCSVVATPSGGAAQTFSFGPGPMRRTFGGFTEGGTVAISNSSAVLLEYDIVGGDVAVFTTTVSGAAALVRQSDGSVQSLSEVTPYVNRTATGTAFTGACEYAGYICTVAAGNITVYDNTSAAGTAIVPTTALVVGAFPIFGAGTNGKMALTTGCHVVLSGAATVNVLVG